MSKIKDPIKYEDARAALLGKVLVFGGKSFQDYELDFSEGMRARVVEVFDATSDEAVEAWCYEVKVDFTDFEQHNRVFSKTIFYDKNNNACLHWHETPSYPKDCIDKVFIGADKGSWPFAVEEGGKRIGPVVLSAENWEKIVDTIGQEALDKYGIKPL